MHTSYMLGDTYMCIFVSMYKDGNNFMEFKMKRRFRFNQQYSEDCYYFTQKVVDKGLFLYTERKYVLSIDIFKMVIHALQHSFVILMQICPFIHVCRHFNLLDSKTCLIQVFADACITRSMALISSSANFLLRVRRTDLNFEPKNNMNKKFKRKK